MTILLLQETTCTCTAIWFYCHHGSRAPPSLPPPSRSLRRRVSQSPVRYRSQGRPAVQFVHQASAFNSICSNICFEPGEAVRADPEVSARMRVVMKLKMGIQNGVLKHSLVLRVWRFD